MRGVMFVPGRRAGDALRTQALSAVAAVVPTHLDFHQRRGMTMIACVS
jgi:hypothetical protein